MYPNDGFRELDRRECFRRLASVRLGRLVHTRHALPAVLPVAFRLDHDGAVLLRTSAASELARAIDQVVVAFEADDVDERAPSGWSVVVTGRAAVVTDPLEQDRLRRNGLCTWAPSAGGLFVRVEPALVTGRELAGRPVDVCGTGPAPGPPG
ncbi:pyridoxamine 5'-phosphate oxidase family protein [Streptomyces qinglanensis]|uniref:Pyridoxamine 5'-phosphate oxidase n=1 Tax=Streptomyces qinglanensis TaxID=943816 RepID=A0A1H9TWK1_9ACTN|nr:pyridoxamine 5'-phosphate oxidase family protein [Streptomyces qinglanensis]SES01354.1 Pyridoxamine 5'-phosphate oxidase [Streptomyces qinglanensis]